MAIAVEQDALGPGPIVKFDGRRKRIVAISGSCLLGRFDFSDSVGPTQRDLRFREDLRRLDIVVRARGVG